MIGRLGAVALLAVGTLTAAAPSDAAAAHHLPVVVVAPHGADSASGSAAHPLATIGAALDRLAHGGIVELKGGVYHQRVTLDHRHGIEIRPYRHQHAVLSGAGLTPPTDISALVEIADSSDVTVRDLAITGYRTDRLGRVPVGIYLHGHDSTVHLIGNHVHDLGNTNQTLGSFDINAHGIAAYGDDPLHPIAGLVISHNTVDHLQLGASESVVVNGNVDGWRITDNDIHDDNNIGIDAIGFEETLTGAYRYSVRNRARNGVIAGNHVSRIRSAGNPAYWDDGWCNCADGIYVDGGTHIAISGNRVSSNDIGIEVAAENGKGNADYVTVTRNVVTGSLFTGITTGGYCNGAADCGGVLTGSSHDNVFTYNRLRGNNQLDDGSPELLIQYYAYRDRFAHNTITATDSAHAVYGTVPDDHGVAGEPGNTSDHNSFAATGATAATLQFGWRGQTYASAAAYRAATGQDRHSAFH